MAKLTKRFIDSVKPGVKDVVYWDDEIPGFGLRVLPSGVKSYLVQYRNEHGRSRRLTIAKHGKITLHLARKEALRVFDEVRRGGDPVADRRARIEAPTVSELFDKYLAGHVDKENRPRTRVENRRLVERHIRPRLGRHKVDAVTRQDMMRLHHELAATPRQANQVLAVCSKAFSLAEFWGMRPENSNPTRGIKRYRENVRERFLLGAELPRLGAALRQYRTGENRNANVTTAAIELLLYTGCRLSEVLNLRWDQVDFEVSTITLGETKAGRPQIVVLNEPARQILGVLHDRPGGERRGKAWVLPSASRLMPGPSARITRPGGKPGEQRPLSTNALEKAWQKIRAAAGLDDVRLHDLRHTVGTYAGQTGANAFIVRDLLRHKNLSMTGRYVNRADGPVRALSDLVGERIAAGLSGETRGEVVPLRREG
jgi:integrase